MSLVPGRLSAMDVEALALQLCDTDRLECHIAGVDPLEALRRGRVGGYCVGVKRKDTGTPVGAYGVVGCVVWSLWAPLSPSERELVRAAAPRVITGLVRHHGPLRNHVPCASKASILWLLKTGCFDVDTEPHIYNEAPFLHFYTKPLDRLERQLNV